MARSPIRIGLCFLLILGCGYGLYGILQRPRPKLIEPMVEAPSVTPLEKELKPQPLLIRFPESVAPLGQVGATLPVMINPSAEGKWKWNSDRILAFYPANDWPAATSYRVDLPPLAENRHLAKPFVEFQTAQAEARITQMEFYQDPVDPEKRQVVATVETNYAIDPEKLRDKIRWEALGGSPLFQNRDRFEIVTQLHHRRFTVRSAAIALPEKEDFVRFSILRGMPVEGGKAVTSVDCVDKVRIPDLYSLFRINGIKAITARRENGDPEQLLVVETTTNVGIKDLASAISAWQLPRDKSNPKEKEKANQEEPEPSRETAPVESDSASQAEAQSEPYDWSSPREVSADVLAASSKIELEAVPGNQEFATQHLFRCPMKAGGHAYILIAKGTKAIGGYILADTFDTIVAVEPIPTEITFQGSGGLLALNGERRLSVVSRGVAGIEFELAKVLPDQINHLVSQTGGKFEDPEFAGEEFSEENISVISQRRLTIAQEKDDTRQYSALDLTPDLTQAGKIQHGLFFIRARALNPANGQRTKAKGAKRFLLVSDLGLISKRNDDESREIFVVSLGAETPVMGAEVLILGKNGLPVFEGKTDSEGHLSTPILKFENEKQPVAIVARLGDDLSFLPFNREDRTLDFSRFDIQGTIVPHAADIVAFPFTERGVYRPGESIHGGILVKRQDWSGKIAGMPLTVEILDQTGTQMESIDIKIPTSGFVEFEYDVPSTAATGEYKIQVERPSKEPITLATQYVRVEEFQPDRMKVTATFGGEKNRVWLPPDDLSIQVHLEDLIGAPSADHLVKIKQRLSPAGFSVDSYGDYQFALPEAPKQENNQEEQELDPKRTDDNGDLTVALDLAKYGDACYRVSLDVEGFESDGGRSVHTALSKIVSGRSEILGYKSVADLKYLPAGTPAGIDLVALAPEGHPIALPQVRLRLVKKSRTAILTKQENGNYKYESVAREDVVKEDQLPLRSGANYLALDTTKAGEFRLEISTPQTEKAMIVDFSVVGMELQGRVAERDAELKIKLAKREVVPGDQLEIAVQAPFSGYGLVTIERERTSAWHWFKSETASSVQHITVPADFEGSGYVNVSFVRSLNSPDTTSSPLSFAVLPFTSNAPRRKIQVAIAAPREVRPGAKISIRYRADRKCSVVIYGVDAGILQVSDYQLPDPLAGFFPKAQLQVETHQILDLIIPEYSKLRSAPGGDGDDHIAKKLNPFSRVTEKPVVFWSGVREAGPEEKIVEYQVPDFFDGTLRLMAVAFGVDGAGATQTDSIVRTPIVITPQIPVFAAPNDHFFATATLTNTTDHDIRVAITPEIDGGIELDEKSPKSLLLRPAGHETVRWAIHATELFGSATVRFTAKSGEDSITRRGTLSVRPGAPYVTSITSGHFGGNSTELKVSSDFYPQFSKSHAMLSTTPFGLAYGLKENVMNFAYDCSEQLTSKAFAALILSDNVDFGLAKDSAIKIVADICNVLRERQCGSGAIGYWKAEEPKGVDFISVYVAEFLTEARSDGYDVPSDLDSHLQDYLRKVSVTKPENNSDACSVARAIYLLTCREVVTTNELINLRDTLDQKFPGDWQKSLAGVYMAATAQLLLKERDASEWIAAYVLHPDPVGSGLHSELADDAQYVTILARHFPSRFQKLKQEDLDRIIKPIENGSFSTISAARTLAALKAMSNRSRKSSLEISESRNGWHSLQKKESSLLSIPLPSDATRIRFSAGQSGSNHPVFFQTVQSGFPRSIEGKANGIEISREYLNADGKPAQNVHQGDTLTVRVRIRSNRKEPIENVAIVDLLPCGCEAIRNSNGSPQVNADWVNQIDLREDRYLFYATAEPEVQELKYQLKITASGQFRCPPILAESMYDHTIQSVGEAWKLESRMTDAEAGKVGISK